MHEKDPILIAYKFICRIIDRIYLIILAIQTIRIYTLGEID